MKVCGLIDNKESFPNFPDDTQNIDINDIFSTVENRILENLFNILNFIKI